MDEHCLEIGYIFYGLRLGKDEKAFLKAAKMHSVKLVIVNTFKKIDFKRLKRRFRNCKIIFNNSAEEKAMKVVKFLEKSKKRVIESSFSYYRDENKWGFCLKCMRKNIPVPKTIMLSKNIDDALNEINEFNKWPVILKRVQGCCGQFVDRAVNIEEAKKTIERFNKKSKNYLPIIAQEFIKSPSYRITMVDGKILQAIVKKKGFWKKTGVYTKDFEKFRVSKKLDKLAKKIYNACSIKICGIDLFKKNNSWIVLEINSQPSYDFLDSEHQMIIERVMRCLVKESNKMAI